MHMICISYDAYFVYNLGNPKNIFDWKSSLVHIFANVYDARLVRFAKPIDRAL